MDVLSYGGGRQTAGMLAMVKLGILEKPDMAVFADTGGELPETYLHIEKYMQPLAEELGIPFETVYYTIRGERVTLYDYAYKYRWLPSPWQRMCTRKFKVEAIMRFLRQFKGQEVVQWLGISAEEKRALRPSTVKWSRNRWPLVEKGLTMRDCVAALETLGIPIPPKSACYYCPFQGLGRWRILQRNHPEMYQKAIELEERARERNPRITLTGRAPLKVYLEGEQLTFAEVLDWEHNVLEAEAGCHSGQCFV